MKPSLHSARLALASLCLILGACATRGEAVGADIQAQALQAHRAWWQAYTAGDVATLDAHTAQDAQAVFSSGNRLARAAMIDAARKNSGFTGFTMRWSDESVRFPRPGLAVVTATSTERAGASLQVFRIIAILDRVGQSDWSALSLQSTRVAQFAPAVPTSLSGELEDFAGAYATPKGRFLTMEVRDGALWMIEPEGKAFKLTPTGPGLFEPDGQSPLNGVLRFLFARDAEGRVASFSRVTEGRVDTFPRVK